jgi:Cu2+-exporting ATPase
LDTVIFDKTGTLTRGSPIVSGGAAVPGGNENDLLARAAAVEANSEHPLAKAIVAEAKRRNRPNSDAADFQALPGRGAQARVNGKSIVVGGPRLLTEAKAAVPGALASCRPGRQLKPNAIEQHCPRNYWFSAEQLKNRGFATPFS